MVDVVEDDEDEDGVEWESRMENKTKTSSRPAFIPWP